MGGLEAKGTPAMVQRVAIAPPQSRVGPLSESERHALIAASPLRGRYDQAIDRESAYEVLAQRAEEAVKEPAVEKTAHKTERAGLGDDLGELAGRAVKSALRQAASQLGRQLARGLLGSLLGCKR